MPITAAAARRSGSRLLRPLGLAAALNPQLLASVAVGAGTDGGVASPYSRTGTKACGRRTALTYYRSDLANAMYHAIDASDPTWKAEGDRIFQHCDSAFATDRHQKPRAFAQRRWQTSLRCRDRRPLDLRRVDARRATASRRSARHEVRCTARKPNAQIKVDKHLPVQRR